MNPKKRVVISVSLLIVCIFVGTAGYMIVEGASAEDAAYMTIITISTVGYKEVIDLTPPRPLFYDVSDIAWRWVHVLRIGIISNLFCRRRASVFTGEVKSAKTNKHA